MLGTQQKAPGLRQGLMLKTAGFSLPADLDAGSTDERTGALGAFTGGDNLDPECILVLEIRGVAGHAQRIQAVLLRTRSCSGESRQLEDYPGSFVQFRQREGHGRPFGGHLDLGAGSYVGASYVVLLAIAAENDWRLRRSPATAKCAGTGRCARTTGAADTSARAASYPSPALNTTRTG